MRQWYVHEVHTFVCPLGPSGAALFSTGLQYWWNSGTFMKLTLLSLPGSPLYSRNLQYWWDSDAFIKFTLLSLPGNPSAAALFIAEIYSIDETVVRSWSSHFCLSLGANLENTFSRTDTFPSETTSRGWKKDFCSARNNFCRTSSTVNKFLLGVYSYSLLFYLQ
jgi:hypothetical protein